MCIIMIKQAGAKAPTEEMLKNMYDRNPDGAGYMFNGKDQMVHIRKGFMNFEKFKNSFEQDLKKNPNSTFVTHCRIGTQGGNTAEMTHPYPLIADYKQMKLTNARVDIGVAHNGIINLTSNHLVFDHNDTMEFIKDYLNPLVRFGNLRNEKRIRQLAERLIGSYNKIVILYGDGDMTILNKQLFIEDKETGLLFSNTTYKQPKYVYDSYDGKKPWKNWWPGITD